MDSRTIRRTRFEWLRELPEPYRTQAIEAVKALPAPRNDLDAMFPSTNVHDALMEMFLFVNTKQGVKYWLDYCYKLHKQLNIKQGVKQSNNYGEVNKTMV